MNNQNIHTQTSPTPEWGLERSGKPHSGKQNSEGDQTVGVPDPEVAPRAVRRTFGAAYKLRIVEELNRCTMAGEHGAILRREGLYSSHIAAWRKLYEQGALKALRDDSRGRKKDPNRQSRLEIERLEREITRLNKKLTQAEMIIDVQKKLSVTLEALRLEEEGQE